MAEDIDRIVGERVRELRKKESLTLKDLAAKLGVSHVHLSHMERGERTWSIERINKVAEVFNLPAALLQDPSVPLENIEEISGILQHLSDLPAERLKAVARLLETFHS